jgi:hypothetical protein
LCTGYFLRGTNKLHSSGKKIWPDGSLYQGSFHNGKAEGNGFFIDSKNGFVFVGEWKEDKISGQGKVT